MLSVGIPSCSTLSLTRPSSKLPQNSINKITLNVRDKRILVIKPKVVEGAVSDLAPVEISWEIAVGALAGVTPFIVAGIEFGKRIIAQKKCEVCKGSGLLPKADYYIRCPNCGGFLPWQSWKRFFTG